MSERTPQRFPKQNRILRRQDFRKVYDTGNRFAVPLFAAFYLCSADEDGPRVGFTVTRAVGNSVIRNRIRRLFREAVRLQLAQLSLGKQGKRWWVVINPRKAALKAPFSELEREIARFFHRCSKGEC